MSEMMGQDALQDLLNRDRVCSLLAVVREWNGKDVMDLMPTAISYAEIVGQFCLDAAPDADGRARTPRDPVHPNGLYSHGCWYGLLGVENEMLKEAWRPFRQHALRNGHPDWVVGKLVETFWTRGKTGKADESVADHWWWLAVDKKTRGLYLNDGTVERVLVNHQHGAVERLTEKDGKDVVVVGTIISDLDVDKQRRQTAFVIDAGGYNQDLATSKYPSRVVIHDEPANVGADLGQGRVVKVQGRYKLVTDRGKRSLLIVADRKSGLINL